MLPQGQESSQDTQESQEQAPEEQGLSQEQPQDSSQEEAPEGQEDSQQAEGEEEEPEGEGEKPEAKPEVKHKRSGGYQRTIQRQERQIAQLTEAIQRLSGQPPQPTQPQKPKTDAERAADEFRSLVRQEAGALAEERQQQEMSRQLAQKWEAQLPADEDEAHEVRQWIADAHSRLRPGPLREALLTSEVTPRIISELLRNPLELARISALPEIQQAREVLRLETKFVSGAAPVKPGPAVRPPPPPSRVGGSASQTSTRRLEDLDIRSYKAAYRSGRR